MAELYGRIEHTTDRMEYRNLENDVTFIWLGHEDGPGGPHVEVRWDGHTVASFSAVKNGCRIEFTEDNFQRLADGWYRANAESFFGSRA